MTVTPATPGHVEMLDLDRRGRTADLCEQFAPHRVADDRDPFDVVLVLAAKGKRSFSAVTNACGFTSRIRNSNLALLELADHGGLRVASAQDGFPCIHREERG